MKAAVFNKPKNITLENKELKSLPHGSVRLRVESCAVCGSDQRIFNHGNNRIIEPRILGHEISGEIVEIESNVSKFKVGDKVSVGADIPCEGCKFCDRGQPNCCDTNLAIGYQFDGGFAEYITLDKLVVEKGPVQKFSNNLDYDLACLAEPLACCINGYEVGLAKKEQKIVIFGAGPIGIMLGLLGQYNNCSDLIIIEPSEFRRNFVKKLFPMAFVINPLDGDVEEKIIDRTSGNGADLLFTACPIVETHKQAINLVAKKGVVNLFGGLPKTSGPIEFLSNAIHYKEAYITGSHGSTPEQHKKALQLIDERLINLTDLITSHVQLENIDTVFTKDHIESNIKTIIKPNLNV